MGARPALSGLILLGLVACASGASGEDTGFHVVSSLPEDGADDVVESQTPELRLSASADPEACGPEALGLVQLNDDGSVARHLELSIEALDGGNKLALDPDQHFIEGATYAFVVSTSGAVCTDVQGRPIRAFSAIFEVP
jgi:hypothetical protein